MNPVAYKTLQGVKTRSGKSGYSIDIGYLPKGSVVAINHIKYRSGRVVVKQKYGGLRTAGWVTLYTKQKKELLKIYIPFREMTKDLKFIRSQTQQLGRHRNAP